MNAQMVRRLSWAWSVAARHVFCISFYQVRERARTSFTNCMNLQHKRNELNQEQHNDIFESSILMRTKKKKCTGKYVLRAHIKTVSRVQCFSSFFVEYLQKEEQNDEEKTQTKKKNKMKMLDQWKEHNNNTKRQQPFQEKSAPNNILPNAHSHKHTRTKVEYT